MNDDVLVAKQARRIDSLELTLSHIQDELKRSYGHIYCIGGPLNDNLLQFTNKQLATVAQIASGVSNSLEFIDEAFER